MDDMNNMNENLKNELKKTGAYSAVSRHIANGIFNHVASEMEIPDYGFVHIHISTKPELLETGDLKREVSRGNITHKAVVAAINRADNDVDFSSSSFAAGLRFCYTKGYLVIFTTDGLFVAAGEDYLYTPYENIVSVVEHKKGILVSLDSGYYVCKECETRATDIKKIDIKTDSEITKRQIGMTLKDIINEYRGDDKEVMRRTENEEQSVEDIIKWYIDMIPSKEYYPAYMINEIGEDDGKTRKKFVRALNGYARSIYSDEAIAFIDTSLFSTGSDGIMFSEEGIAFDYAFQKVFLRYDEMDDIVLDGRELKFIGNFSGVKDNTCTTPSISNIYYNIEMLKECINEIRQVV